MGMELNEYQAESQLTAHYPKEHALYYTTIALVGEAGEYANEVKKLIRNDSSVLTAERKEKMLSELGDTLWYLAACATVLGVTLEEIARGNIKKLMARHSKGKVIG